MVAGAKRGMMPSAFSLLHVDNDSPRVSVFIHTLLSFAFTFIGNTDDLVNYLTITSTMSTICSLSALAIIKWKSLPVSSEAVRYSIFWPLLNIIINVALLAIPIAQEPTTSAIGFGIFVAGIVAYYINMGVQRIEPVKSVLWRIDESFTQVCQILTWSVADTSSTFSTQTKVVPEDDKIVVSRM